MEYQLTTFFAAYLAAYTSSFTLKPFSVLFAVMLALAACSEKDASEAGVDNIGTGGTLILVFHGDGGTGEGLRNDFGISQGFERLADAAGRAIIVYPDVICKWQTVRTDNEKRN